MAGPKSFAGFDRAQQNNYYWYWQRWGAFSCSEWKWRLLRVLFLTYFGGNLQTIALKMGVLKQLKQKSYLLVTFGKGESSVVLDDSALVADAIPVVSPLLLEWTLSSSSTRGTPLAAGMSSSTAVFFLAVAVVPQWMEMSTPGLRMGPLDSQLELPLHPRYHSLNEPCAGWCAQRETSFSYLTPPHPAIQFPTAVAFAPYCNTRE